MDRKHFTHTHDKKSGRPHTLFHCCCEVKTSNHVIRGKLLRIIERNSWVPDSYIYEWTCADCGAKFERDT